MMMPIYRLYTMPPRRAAETLPEPACFSFLINLSKRADSSANPTRHQPQQSGEKETQDLEISVHLLQSCLRWFRRFYGCLLFWYEPQQPTTHSALWMESTDPNLRDGALPEHISEELMDPGHRQQIYGMVVDACRVRCLQFQMSRRSFPLDLSDR